MTVRELKGLIDSRGVPEVSRSKRIITPSSPEFGCAVWCSNMAADTGGAWTSASDPIAIPFRLSYPFTIVQLGWRNGSSAGDNHDVGIYTDAWVRLVSAGSTVGTGSSAWQWVDVTDTPLEAGPTYYLVKVCSVTTTNRVAWFGAAATSVGAMDVLGVKDTTTNSVPLPDPLVGMGTPTHATRIPVCGMAVKAPL